MRRGLKTLTYSLIWIAWLPLLVLGSVAGRISRRTDPSEYRVVLGATPVINYSLWAKAIRESGRYAVTVTFGFYGINTRDDWDIVLPASRVGTLVIAPWFAFKSLILHEVLVTSYDGFLIRAPLLWRIQGWLSRLASQKIVVIPYGSDAYVYDRVRSPHTLNGLLIQYPEPGRRVRRVRSRILYWNRWADVVIPAGMTFDGFARWDVITPNSLCVDVQSEGDPAQREQHSDSMKIFHSSNHDALKGTWFLERAVRRLQSQGCNIELQIARGWSNDDVRKCLTTWADVHVDQLIMDGWGMSALEGLSSGIPVIANLQRSDEWRLFRRYSFMDECPIVSADPESIEEVLLTLYLNPIQRRRLGELGRNYVMRRHSLRSGGEMFAAIFDFFAGRREQLWDLYLPTEEPDSQAIAVSELLCDNKLRFR